MDDEYDYGADVERAEYDSGPFCRHWGDPGDCEEACAACGHPCRQHPYDDSCEVLECACEGFSKGDTARGEAG